MKPDLSKAIPITHPKDYTFNMVNGIFYYEYIFLEKVWRGVELSGKPVWFLGKSSALTLTKDIHNFEVCFVDLAAQYPELLEDEACVDFDTLINYHYLPPEHYPEYYV